MHILLNPIVTYVDILNNKNRKMVSLLIENIVINAHIWKSMVYRVSMVVLMKVILSTVTVMMTSEKTFLTFARK